MNRRAIIVFVFLLFIFFRFVQLEQRLAFGWDQTMNAWVVKDLLVDHKFPLLGMAAKGNSGVFIGPAYYYILAIFYAVTKLHPIAAGYCAGVMSVITGIALFLAIRVIFTERISLFCLGLAAISSKVIFFDRLAGPVNLLPLSSVLVFYLWYQILRGKTKLLPFLALAIGFAFHLHVTALFYLFISLLCLPFLLRQRVSFKTYFLSAIIFLSVFIPNIIANILDKNHQAVTMVDFFNTFYHGVHLRRILQLLPDAFIEFESTFLLGPLTFIRYLMPPLFMIVLWKLEERRKVLILMYLTALWYGVPWFVLSTYRGEITNYYFAITRIPTLFITGYLLDYLLMKKKWYLVVLVIGLVAAFAVNNIRDFWQSNDRNFIKQQERAQAYIQSGKRMDFQEGIAESYLYFYYRNFDMR